MSSTLFTASISSQRTIELFTLRLSFEVFIDAETSFYSDSFIRICFTTAQIEAYLSFAPKYQKDNLIQAMEGKAGVLELWSNKLNPRLRSPYRQQGTLLEQHRPWDVAWRPHCQCTWHAQKFWKTSAEIKAKTSTEPDCSWWGPKSWFVEKNNEHASALQTENEREKMSFQINLNVSNDVPQSNWLHKSIRS